LHGGSVEAKSEGPGRGSEFVVRLPVPPDPPSVARLSPGAAGGLNAVAGRILVVDDNRDAAESLGMLLECLGAEVFLAHDGYTALETFEDRKPSVVLLD